MKKELPPLAKVLPSDAAQRLQRAARTPIPRSDVLARVKAIEHATEQAKLNYPTFFRIRKEP